MNLIGDFILNIYSKNVVEDKLISEVGVPSSYAKTAMAEISDFLTGVKSMPDVPEAPKDLKEKLELRPDGTPASGAAGETAGVRPLTRDEVLRALSPARTMAGDIASLSKQTPASPSTPPTPPKAG